MKNKIKKIIPLILCFVMVLGSCLTVNAAKISADKLNIGSSGSFGLNYYSDNTYHSNLISYSITNCIDDVRVVPHIEIFSNNYFHRGVFLVSKSSFTYSYDSEMKLSDSKIDYSSLSPDYMSKQDCSSLTYNGIKYYYATPGYQGAYNSNDFELFEVSSSYIDCQTYVDGVTSSSINLGPIFEKMYLADFTWDDGVSLDYASQPIGSIVPPQNLSIYRGYSNADKQYKFQIQWDKPEDTDLNVEVMYNIHWKEGTGSALGFGTHVYKKYQHLVFEDGHSAQTNKLQYLEDDLLKGYFESQNVEVPPFYNIDEIYIRFAKEIDGVVNYSLWRKIDYLNLDEGNGFDSTEDDFNAESSTGAFDTSDNWIDQSVQNGEIVDGSDKEDAKAPGLDANGDNITDVNKPIVNPNVWDEGTLFLTFTNALQSALDFVGEFPSMLSDFFGFLPPAIIGCISIGLVMVILLRFLGR